MKAHKTYFKDPYYRSPKYLEWIRGLRCAVCGSCPPCEAAHQRVLGRGGMGIKPPDDDVLPYCYKCHKKEHDKGIYTLWHENSDLDFEDDEDIKNHIRILSEAYKQLWLSNEK